MIHETTRIAFLEGLTPQDTASFFQLAAHRTFADGEAILREGDEGQTLYIVASGRVQIEKATLDRQQEVITSLGDGECFGELALVDSEPRSATVRALGAVEVLEWDRPDLDAFFNAHPNLHRRVLENLTKITARRIRLMDEALVQSVYDSLIWLDGDCRVRKWNCLTNGRTLFDRARAPNEGQDLFEWVPQLGEGIRQKLAQVMASGDTAVLQLEYEDGDGKMAFFELTAAAQGDGIVLGVRDVTESKTLESRLIQAEKLAMVGQMSAEIGHELRNYLTVIMGHTELLQIHPKLQGDARIDRGLKAISDQLVRMEQFASGLMDMGMLRSKTEPSSVNVLIEKLVPFIQGQNRFRRVAFSLDLDRGLPLIDIDPGQIQQVLLNVYANAADAMGKGVIETVTRLDKAGGRVSVAVIDHGPGMSEEVLARIFDSGFTTKKTGHGFGLAICKRIAENHGGHIEVISREGAGTTFTLLLPIQAGY